MGAGVEVRVWSGSVEARRGEKGGKIFLLTPCCFPKTLARRRSGGPEKNEGGSRPVTEPVPQPHAEKGSTHAHKPARFETPSTHLSQTHREQPVFNFIQPPRAFSLDFPRARHARSWIVRELVLRGELLVRPPLVFFSSGLSLSRFLGSLLVCEPPSPPPRFPRQATSLRFHFFLVSVSPRSLTRTPRRTPRPPSPGRRTAARASRGKACPLQCRRGGPGARRGGR